MSFPCIGTALRALNLAGTVSILPILACLAWGGASTARAESAKRSHMPSAVLLATGGAPSGGEALDSVIQAGLEELALVNITARPGMDLGALQLALDCVAETTQCLHAVTTQSGAQILIAPTVQRTPSELILTLLRFDARGDGDMRRVLRRFPGKTLGPAALDAVPEMLRELFGLPPKPKPAAEAPAPAKTPPATKPPAPAPLPLPEGPMEPAASRPTPVGPLVLAGAGVLVIGGGVVAGLMMQANQDKYNKRAPATIPEAQSATDTKSTGQTQATVANVLFAVGGAAVVAGGIWLIVELSRPRPQYDETLTSLRPALGPHQLGLVLTQRGDWL
jgi:hypothetical protein